jgi:hypothetical protein
MHTFEITNEMLPNTQIHMRMNKRRTITVKNAKGEKKITLLNVICFTVCGVDH